MSVPLPRHVAPGETINVEIAWTSKVPSRSREPA